MPDIESEDTFAARWFGDQSPGCRAELAGEIRMRDNAIRKAAIEQAALACDRLSKTELNGDNIASRMACICAAHVRSLREVEK